MKKVPYVLLSLAALCAPYLASAHEVYVLNKEQIAEGLATPAFSATAVIAANLPLFLFWTAVAVVAVGIVLYTSTSKHLERWFDPFLMRVKRYAPQVARITVGFGLIASAYAQALFGPELPLLSIFGNGAMAAAIVLGIVGILFIVDWGAQIGALLGLVIFGIATAEYGQYMLTYANYFGELLIVFLFSKDYLFSNVGLHKVWRSISGTVHRYSFLILRVAFGTSLLYSSYYAKFLHNDLALQVASLHFGNHLESLAFAMGFEPHFMVLGAGIVEIVAGCFFILGLEIRFTALFIEFWLALSLWYFGESVWPHIVLIGIPIALFLHGYDRYSLEGLIFKRGRTEPVL